MSSDAVCAITAAHCQILILKTQKFGHYLGAQKATRTGTQLQHYLIVAALMASSCCEILYAIYSSSLLLCLSACVARTAV